MSRSARFAIAAVLAVIGADAASAVTVAPATLLDPQSLQYFGLALQDNVRTSTAIGTLDISGTAGCGVKCVATSALGASPYVELFVSEQPSSTVGGGYARATLQYLVQYNNPVAGYYPVHIHAADILDIQGAATGQTYLGFAPSFNYNIYSGGALLIDQTHCVGGCNGAFGNAATQGPLGDYDVQMYANYTYVVTLIANIFAASDGQVSYAKVDPTFSTQVEGGSFSFSPGVLQSDVPEPASWAMLLTGFALIGTQMRRRRPNPTHA